MAEVVPPLRGSGSLPSLGSLCQGAWAWAWVSQAVQVAQGTISPKCTAIAAAIIGSHCHEDMYIVL